MLHEDGQEGVGDRNEKKRRHLTGKVEYAIMCRIQYSRG